MADVMHTYFLNYESSEAKERQIEEARQAQSQPLSPEDISALLGTRKNPSMKDAPISDLLNTPVEVLSQEDRDIGIRYLLGLKSTEI